MFSTDDTIVAIATPPGRGGIGVVRLSGPDARAVAATLLARSRPLEPRRATFTLVKLPPERPREQSAELVERPIDQVVATYFPAPRSYTGEDVVELSAHGSPVVLRSVVAAAIAAGARAAAPGEFTLRAFLNGRIDLAQAEAVADLIEAATPQQARAAFDQLQGTLTSEIGAVDAALFDLIARLEASVDFPDEGYHFIAPGDVAHEIDGLCARTRKLLDDACRGRLLREGLEVAVVGKPNVGKSSVFNALVGAGRAIVSDVPGTTRDLITEAIDLDGLRVTLVDTAGIRSTGDGLEAEGVARSERAHAVADLTLVVLDRSLSLDADDTAVISQVAENKRVIVANKADLPAAWDPARAGAGATVSARTGAGLDELRQQIARALDVEHLAERPAITNARHIMLVRQAQDSMLRARDAAAREGGALPEEFVLADLQDARAALEEISGRRTSDELLAHIFSRFCVGK
jgi:tRNA modification GTPase